MKNKIIYLGTVTSICDEYGGNRIKVKIPIDGNVEPKEGWPYAFPLLPKHMQVMPKEGEMVFVFLTDPGTKESQRYYIGPIISQPQKMYNNQKGILDTPASLLESSHSAPLETISHFSSTFGSFPKTNDIALLGRKGEDVILKDDEINIRCGARNHADGSENESLVGEVIFNKTNPAYIQLKHRRGASKTGANLINLVGSNINFISNEDAQKITDSMRNFNNADICKKEKEKEFWEKTIEEYLNEKDTNDSSSKTKFGEPDFDEIINKLHQIPYGDILVEVLEIIREAIQQHTHPWVQLPPTSENVPAMIKLKTWGQSADESESVDLSEILLSKTVRTS